MPIKSGLNRPARGARRATTTVIIVLDFCSAGPSGFGGPVEEREKKQIHVAIVAPLWPPSGLN